MALLPESSCGILVCVCKGVVCTRARASVGPMRNTWCVGFHRVVPRRTVGRHAPDSVRLRSAAKQSVNVFFCGARRMPRVTLRVQFCNGTCRVVSRVAS
jgi:hypothetical protein